MCHELLWKVRCSEIRTLVGDFFSGEIDAAKIIRRTFPAIDALWTYNWILQLPRVKKRTMLLLTENSWVPSAKNPLMRLSQSFWLGPVPGAPLQTVWQVAPERSSTWRLLTPVPGAMATSLTVVPTGRSE